MKCSLKFKRDVPILKKLLSFGFCALLLKLFLIQVVISIPLWIKLAISQLSLFFPCNFCGLFSYARGDLVVPGASACERGGILALSHIRDARIFSQLVVFAFSQEKEKQVFYFIIKLC